MVSLRKITRKGRAFFLAYDQGFEHGPTDFNEKSVSPMYIIEIAKNGPFTGVIFHKGIAEKYSSEIKKAKVPLIIKLNGKTNLVSGDPVSTQVCSVSEAVRLGAVAVGFSVYIGSIHESEMIERVGKIQEEAHKKGIPLIVWVYPRGKSVEKKSKTELMAYAARVGLEIGADIIKIRYEGNKKDLKWAIKSAGMAKVVIAGGSKKGEKEFLSNIKDIVDAGCFGFAIGRNIWQDVNPLRLSKMIGKIIWA